MDRLNHWLLRRLSGLRYALRRRLTPAGRLVLGALVASAALGVDTDQSLVHQVFALLAALLAVALVLARRFRAAFRVSRVLPPFVTAGEPFRYRLRVRLEDGRPLAGALLLEEFADPRPAYPRFHAATGSAPARWAALVGERRPPEVEPLALPTLHPGREAVLGVEVRAPRRGEIRFTAASLARADPLGLARGLARVRAPGSVLVLPRRYPVPALALPGTRAYQHGGVARAASKGDSEEFVGLRDYRPGDPLQRVHWKSFARVGTPIVKEYQDEFFERHALVLDTFAGADTSQECFEEAVSVAASFACTVETQESLLDLMFVGDRTYTFTAGPGQLHADGMLSILAGVQPCRDRPFAELHRAVVGRRGALSGCILILIAWDEARRALLEELRALATPLQVLLVAGEDPGVPAGEGVRVLRPGRIAEDLAAP